jgi:hypothetical protein
MKTQENDRTNALIRLARVSLAMLAILVFCTLAAFGQVSDSAIPKPEDEFFTPDLDLVKYRIYRIAPDKFTDKTSDTFRVYNADGSLWYEFSLSVTHPLYYENNKKSGFDPIFPIENALFKLVASSNHWYAIETSSTTKDVKYMRIDDPFLRKWSIQMEIKDSPNIRFDQKSNPLLDEPNGKAKNYDNRNAIRFSGASIQGDWLQVKMNVKDRINDLTDFGWIRWKKDNELAVSFDLRSR